MSSTWDALQGLRLPDDWQMRAIRALGEGSDVIVQAPTGSGKTYIFEQYIEQRKTRGQAIYTSPTRALANDKYAEWKRRGWKVGITTGDLVRDPDAPVVVATLEAQQRQKQAALFVIDEYQWIHDEGRGHHYEGALISFPKSTQLLLLSGSVANPGTVAAWLKRMGRTVEVIEQGIRPVPLEEVDVDFLSRRVTNRISGFWMRRLAGALHEDLGPILVFAPHRKEAEKIARQAAAALPCANPLRLSAEQEALAGPELSRLLAARVGYHHSGLTYAQRAGLIEPLAKAGQLRVVVATLGLSAGINFSLRSVLVTGSTYTAGGVPQEVSSSELLQMFGRAGRRGLDDCGYVLITHQTPRLSQGRPETLKRHRTFPWNALLSELADGVDPIEAGDRFAKSLFSEVPLRLGHEATARIQEALPCGLRTDTARARLVRRRRPAAPACKGCAHRNACYALSPSPTLYWWWTRLKLVTRDLKITERGRRMTAFSGPEGLGVIAAIEDERYDLDDLLNDLGDLFAADRFCGDEPRWAGRLADACRRMYGDLECEGFLQSGVPISYGFGASEFIGLLRQGKSVPDQLLPEQARRGDLDRLWIEWKSLLRQIVSAPEEGTERWSQFRALAVRELERFGSNELPVPPVLTAEQERTVSHRL